MAATQTATATEPKPRTVKVKSKNKQGKTVTEERTVVALTEDHAADVLTAVIVKPESKLRAFLKENPEQKAAFKQARKNLKAFQAGSKFKRRAKRWAKRIGIGLGTGAAYVVGYDKYSAHKAAKAEAAELEG